MNQTLLSSFGTSTQRVEHALDALREGRGVMVLDDENRENEGDMIFAAENMTVEQMALTIRHGSGIVCLCITEDRRKQLDLPMMVENNTSAFGTGFTVTIEAAHGVTTGVSAADRLTTVRAAIADGAKPSDLHRLVTSSAARAAWRRADPWWSYRSDHRSGYAGWLQTRRRAVRTDQR